MIIMPKKLFFCILSFVLIILFIGLFQSDLLKTMNDLNDPQAVKQAFKYKNAREIDFGNQSAYVHCYQGYDIEDFVSGNFATSIDRVTRIRFWCSNRKNLDIVVRCRQAGSAAEQKKLVVSVNGKKIGDALMSHEWQDLKFEIPRKQLNISDNIMTLETPKGTQPPEIYFDVDSVRFPGKHGSLIISPQYLTSDDGWWEINPGETLTIYPVVFPNERLRITGFPSGNGIIHIERLMDGFQRDSLWLGSLWTLRKTQAEFVFGNGSDNFSEKHCAKITLSNPDNWISSQYRIRVSHEKTTGSEIRDNHIEQAEEQIKKPNIFVITLDSLRADAVGAYGNCLGLTPVLDGIAKLGRQCEPSVAAAPYTTSSVTSLMTGVNPEIHRVFKIGNTIPESLQTLAEQLKQEGYQTVGVNAMQSINGAFGFRRGFDQYLNLFDEKNDNEDPEVNGDQVVDTVKTVLQSMSSQSPIFLYVHLREPHLPYSPPHPFPNFYCDGNQWEYLMELKTLQSFTGLDRVPSLQEISGLKCLYESGLRYGDMCLGKIIGEIKDCGLWNDSLVIILSDHGEAFWEHEWLFHNNAVFEEMVAIPVVYTGGYAESAGHKILPASGTTFINHEILSLTGIESVNPYASNFQEGFFHMQSHGIGRFGPIAFYQPPWKFIGQFGKPHKAQLFNLPDDPRENNNLASQYPLMAESFQNMIELRSLPEHGITGTIQMSMKDIEQLQALGYLNE